MPSPSRGAPVADLATLERLDGFAPLRNGLGRLSAKIAEWAGIPMPLDDARLVVEPRYPNAETLMSLGKPPAADDAGGATLRNVFYSRHRRCDVMIWNERDGRLDWGLVPAMHHLSHDLLTLGAAVAWGLEQEARAQRLLARLVKHHAFKSYLLTGMFLESSARSHVTYLFRRLKPTVALSMRGASPKILAALCLHPIAYYEGSWAGAMCPTDDVIAHLMLMRGDEAMFWRRASQHAAHRPEAGL
jgi:hypothetical protein